MDKLNSVEVGLSVNLYTKKQKNRRIVKWAERAICLVLTYCGLDFLKLPRISPKRPINF